MNFSNVKDWTIYEGSVIRVTDSLNRVIWEKGSPQPTPETTYFYIEDASGAANTVTIKKVDSNAPTVRVYSSTDQTSWTSMGNTSTTGITVTVPANGKVYFRATANTWSNSYTNECNVFDISGDCNVGGNIMSLIYGDNFTNQTAFPNNTNSNLAKILSSNPIIDAGNLVLPATTLTQQCYWSMFTNCYDLVAAPALPATTMAQSCYQNMFSHCTSLTTAPALPATTLADYCYQSMFSGCTLLNSVTTYAQDISARYCISNWLQTVSATGDFYNYGGATYPSGSSGIPSGWTVHAS